LKLINTVFSDHVYSCEREKYLNCFEVLLLIAMFLSFQKSRGSWGGGAQILSSPADAHDQPFNETLKLL
jgi:hypothetical protein